MPSTQSKRDVLLKTSLGGGAATDQSEAQAQGTLLRGGRGDEHLAATSDADWWIEGRGGADQILGAGGDDLLIAGRARLADAGIDGDPDTDDAVGVFTPDAAPGGVFLGVSLDGGGGDDVAIGGRGDDSLTGGEGDDSLWGFEGDDVLTGGEGDDFLAAGRGDATLDGGAGLNTFSWADLAYRFGAGQLAGVVLNLSASVIRYESGARQGEARIVLVDAAGGTALLGEADTAAAGRLRPGGERALDLDPCTAGIELDLLFPSIHRLFEPRFKIDTITRYEGTLGEADVAVLGAGFVAAGLDADGYATYARGTEIVQFRDFETILIA